MSGDQIGTIVILVLVLIIVITVVGLVIYARKRVKQPHAGARSERKKTRAPNKADARASNQPIQHGVR